MKSTIKISVSNYNSGGAVIVAVVPFNDIITAINYYNAMEMPFARRTAQIPISTRQGSKNSVAHSMTSAKIFGITSAQLADSDYGATTGANPANIWYWNIMAFSPSVGNVSCTIDIDLEYDVVFYEPIDPGVSVLSDPEKDHVKVPRAYPSEAVNLVVPTSKPLERVAQSFR